MADPVQVQFGAQIDSLVSGTEAVKNELDQLNQKFDDLKSHAEGVSSSTDTAASSLNLLSEAFKAVIAKEVIDKVDQFAASMEALGTRTERAMSILGASSETIATMDAVAKSTGTSSEALVNIFARLGMALEQADGGNKRAAASLQALHINAKQFIDLPFENKLEILSERFSKMEDGTKKTAIAIGLLGRAGFELIPFLNQGPEGIKRFNDMVQLTGATATPAFLDATGKMTMANTELSMSFRGLGIALTETLGRGWAGLLDTIAKVVEKITEFVRTNETARTALQLFAIGLANIGTVAQEIGMNLSAAFQAAEERAKGSAEIVSTAWTGVGTIISTYWSGFLDFWRTLFQGMYDVAADTATQIGTIFSDLGALISSAISGNLSGVSEAWSKLTTDASNSASNIGKAYTESMAKVQEVQKQSTEIMAKAWADMNAAMEQTAQNTAQKVAQIYADMAARVTKLYQDAQSKFSAPAPGATPGPKSPAPGMDLGGSDAAMSKLQAQLAVIQADYQMAVDKINSEYKMSVSLFGEAEQQKTQALLAALSTRTSAEIAAIDAVQAKYAAGSKEYERLEAEKTKILAKAAQERQKIELQAQEAMWQKWKSTADDIAGAFNSNLRGLFQGTMTFSQAIGRTLGDLIIKWTGDLIKFGAEWVAKQLFMSTATKTFVATDVSTHAAGEAAKTSATTAGVTSRVSAEAAGSQANMFTMFTDAIKWIFAQAAKVFAGVFAFLSPALGPAAAGPAAASEATVMAAASSIPAFDVGTDVVMRSGLAMIHAGEQIVPAQGSGPFTGANAGGTGGGPSITVSLSAWDAQSVQAWLKSGGAKKIAQAVAPVLDRNLSARAKY